MTELDQLRAELADEIGRRDSAEGKLMALEAELAATREECERLRKAGFVLYSYAGYCTRFAGWREAAEAWIEAAVPAADLQPAEDAQ